MSGLNKQVIPFICVLATCLLCSCSQRQNIQEELPPVPSTFVIESGPEPISGWMNLYVIKHKETGARYVLAYYTSYGVSLSPLPDSPK